MSFKARIYIAGPYIGGDVARNVAQAIEVADQVLEAGYAPFVPHLFHFWHLTRERSLKDWIALDNAWLRTCHALYRIPGESKGADAEVELADRLHIPVVFSMEGLERLAMEPKL